MKNKKKDIRALTKAQLQEFFVANDDKSFRGSQVYEWLWNKGAHSFEAMTNIAKGFRAQLADYFTLDRPEILERQPAVRMLLRTRGSVDTGP